PKNHRDRPRQLHNLVLCLRKRYLRLGNLTDLQTALQNQQEAVALSPNGHPNHAGRLQQLGVCLSDRYYRLGDLTDLEAALRNIQEAVTLTPEGHPGYAARLQNLGVAFIDRYRRIGDLTDLEAGLRNARKAVDLTPEGHPEHAVRLQNLGSSLSDRYYRLGQLTDLETGFQNQQEAVALAPKGHPYRATCLQSLASFFRDRYIRLGDLGDLEAALKNYQEAVALTPESHPDRPFRLQNLGVSFSDRYHRIGDLADLEAALRNAQEAVDLTPKGHPDRPHRLQNLSVSFSDRYGRNGHLADLEAALRNAQEGADLTPKGHPHRPGHLHTLGMDYGARYRRIEDLADLEAALRNAQEAVDLTPKGHPDHARRLQTLAVFLHERYRRLGNPDDFQHTFSTYELSLQSLSSTSNFFDSWKAALKWADWTQAIRSSRCVPAYSAAFHFLPNVLWIGTSLLAHQDATKRLNIAGALSNAVAACLDHSKLSPAVELLEQGTATRLQQLLELKSSPDTSLPSWDAERLQLLSSQLFSGHSQNPHGDAIERDALIKQIRDRPGFANFLLPKTYEVLVQASQRGPIIILNSHKDHCDAIILLHPSAAPIHLPFPDFELEELVQQRNGLKDFILGRNIRARGEEMNRLIGYMEGQEQYVFKDRLEWLWQNIVSHVYNVLEQNSIKDGRLWWCPMGMFTGLPLHAASPSDQFIQSYTPTLGALLDANSQRSSHTTPAVGVVGVTHNGPHGKGVLPGVKQEIDNIISVVGAQNITRLLGDQATVQAVKLQLQSCSWMHLACHGSQNLQHPPKSCLKLYEGSLELETILQMSIPHAEFAFLAACETAMGDSNLVNESFHLGAGFLAAGFRGVIGTMWSMDDQDGPVVAEVVYNHLFGSGKTPEVTDAAKGLQLAVRKLRDLGVPYERWVPFIHMGI
ncbi:CHAT domain-containing protein, partial [Mycena rosella]